MPPAIRIESLGKSYRINHADERNTYRTLSEDLVEMAKAPLRSWRRHGTNGRTEEFWALKNVDFEVQPGEVVGVIGRNGAGKSTLLKILSRITEPTEGKVRLRGRVGSLLEVGTGFHPELTGRENVYLNGSILGMSHKEIDRRFDEIVAFSEVERFLDTPVKRYSSGMYVRLAFAVAAHLEPEILIVDEVLAVGDAEFQKKCLGRMGNVAKEGRTVLFVSHNMTAITSLCNRAVLLDAGRVSSPTGSVSELVNQYLGHVTSTSETSLHKRTDRSGDGTARITAIEINTEGREKVIRSTSSLKVVIYYESDKDLRSPVFLVGIYDLQGAGLFLLSSEMAGGLPSRLPGRGKVECVTGPINLTAGRCSVNVALQTAHGTADYVQYATQFDVDEEDFYGTGKVPPRSWVANLLRQEWHAEERV